ncbi:MAG: HNH endonuclease signature motif containing protein [Chloroflexota bacterium]
MSSYIPEALRKQVIERANFCCEYCLLHQDDGLYKHEVDHIIPEKHCGTTAEGNLCLACFECNRYKGTDFASFDPNTGNITTLYNPREDDWESHFRLNKVTITPRTAKGRVTVFVLKLNEPIRFRARQALSISGRYPLK